MSCYALSIFLRSGSIDLFTVTWWSASQVATMPKKFKGENSKASEARARKESKRQAGLEEKQKALEDEYWRDDDKQLMKKQERKVCTMPFQKSKILQSCIGECSHTFKNLTGLTVTCWECITLKSWSLFLPLFSSKDNREKKKLEQLERKKEKEKLLEDEMASLKSAKPTPAKVTRAEIAANREREAAEGMSAMKWKNMSVLSLSASCGLFRDTNWTV